MLTLRRIGPTAQTLLANGLLGILALATGVMAARLLGPEGRGELAAIQATVGFLTILASLGLTDATVYVVSKQRHVSTSIVTTATAVSILCSAVVAAVGWLALPVVLAAQEPAVVSAARFYLLTLPVFAATGASFQALRALGAFGRWNAARLLPPVGWLLVLTVAASMQVKDGGDVARLYVIALVLLCVPGVLLLKGLGAGSWQPQARLVPGLLRFGLPAMLTAVPQAVSLRIDQVVIAGLFTADDLGIYAVAVAWGAILLPLAAAIGAVLFPRIASTHVAATGGALLATSSRQTVLVSCTAAAMMIPAAAFAIPLLFGPGFERSTPSAVILTAASIPLSLSLVLAEGMRGLGRPRFPLYAETAGAVASVLALAALIKPLGIEGAALASAGGYTLATLILVKQSIRVTGQSWKDFLFPTFEDARVLARWLNETFNSRRTS